MRKHVLIILGILIVLLGAAFLYLSQPDEARLSVASVMGPRPQITAPRNQLFPTFQVAEAVGWQGNEMPTAAAGLTVQPFARGLDHPRWLYRLPNGDVLVSESAAPGDQASGITGFFMRRFMAQAGAGGPSPNRIILLRDANGDGVAEARTVLMEGLNSPSGMVLLNGYLYIADTDALVRVPFTAGQTRITARPELVVRLPHGGFHWARNVIAAPDGQLLYVSVGSSSNIGENGMDAEDHRANILEVNPATRTLRILAAGLRNPNGMAIEPRSHRLWAVVNERDRMGSDLPPDYMSAIEFGDHFGWPWYYWGGYPDSRVQEPNPALQEYSKRPDYALGPHTASLGLAFSNDARLGDRFANGVFVSRHGSWNRAPAAGYDVIYVPFAANGFPERGRPPLAVLGGFLDAEGRARGRPVDVATDANGGLLVSDDVGGAVWRVSAGR